MQSGASMLLIIVGKDDGYQEYLFDNYSLNCSDIFYALFYVQGLCDAPKTHKSYTHCEGINQIKENFPKTCVIKSFSFVIKINK